MVGHSIDMRGSATGKFFTNILTFDNRRRTVGCQQALDFLIIDRKGRSGHFFLRIIERHEYPFACRVQLSIDMRGLARTHLWWLGNECCAVVNAGAPGKGSRVHIENITTNDFNSTRDIMDAGRRIVQHRLQMVVHKKLRDSQRR